MINSKWLKNLSLLFLCLILGVSLFILGFQHTFPGQTISRYLEQQIAARTILQAKITPVEWRSPFRLNVERVTLLAPPSLPLTNLFVFENLQATFLPELSQFSDLLDFSKLLSLSEQNLEIRADAYGGEILGTVSLTEREQAQFTIQKMELDRIPAVNLFPYGFLKGSVEVLGHVRNLKELQAGKTRLPKGKINAKLENIQIKFENLEKLIPGGLNLPELSFSEIEVDLDYNRLLTIHKIQLHGSIEGSIDGKIFLNQRNLMTSRIQLHLMLKLSKEIEKDLGPMVFFVKGLQCGDVMDFDLLGTISRLNPPKKRACS